MAKVSMLAKFTVHDGKGDELSPRSVRSSTRSTRSPAPRSTR